MCYGSPAGDLWPPAVRIRSTTAETAPKSCGEPVEVWLRSERPSGASGCGLRGDLQPEGAGHDRGVRNGGSDERGTVPGQSVKAIPRAGAGGGPGCAGGGAGKSDGQCAGAEAGNGEDRRQPGLAKHI